MLYHFSLNWEEHWVGLLSVKHTMRLANEHFNSCVLPLLLRLQYGDIWVFEKDVQKNGWDDEHGHGHGHGHKH
jgi:hypothetical protein